MPASEKRKNLRARMPLGLALSLCLFLCGCQAQLFDNLREDEANAIIAALQEGSIPVSKQPGNEGTYRVMIDENDFARAMRILTERGLPSRRFDDFGQVFGKVSMFSTPVEEKARYLYAMQEELARTISDIDGVLVARVHLVLPEQDQLGRELQKPSAAVLIKYVENDRHDLSAYRSDIRRLISASVPNIDEERINVTFSPAVQIATPAPLRYAPPPTLFGFRLAALSSGDLWWAPLVGFLAGAAATMAAGWFWYKRKRQ